MTRYVCNKCDCDCELISVDEGGYEEFWGAKVWREDFTSYSDCCNSEYEELEDDGN